MGLNDFAMVEELASLIRDNLTCKHLVLSVEEALVNFLQNNTSVDGVLKLRPMNSYNRLLLHRLADIFGFAHESVGEGEERHLVLVRCPETSMPSILVSDLLEQYDDIGAQYDDIGAQAKYLNENDEVEELASLIRNNLPCKHLVLSVEETLVNFLQNDSSVDGVLELQPTSSYNRHLLHRLADIFGFEHESVGEGEERHLVLERCPETSIPSVLVSDLLRQYDVSPTPKILEVLEKRKDDLPEQIPEIPKSELSLEEREAAYLAARERIFSVGERTTAELVKQRPQHDPMVARRMIAHALGQKMKPADHEDGLTNSKEKGAEAKNPIQKDEEGAFSSGAHEKHLDSLGNKKGTSHSDSGSPSSAVKIPPENIDKSNKTGTSCTERNESKVSKNNFSEEHAGAAKRLFVNALGLHPRNIKSNKVTKDLAKASP